MNPTQEQSAILDAVLTTQDNLQVWSLAGTGKTSTNVMIAEAQPKVNILALAFNKRIAEEMVKRLPPNCESRTINGVCHRAWGDTIGRRCQVDTSKSFKLLKAEIDHLRGAEKDEAYKDFAETLDMISTAKTSGYVPDGHFDQAKPLIRDQALFEEILDPIPSDLQAGLVKRVMIRSIKMGFDGTLDFDDQVLLPTVFSAVFPMFPLVLIDEAQDLSALNHTTLRKLARKRIISVGDELQSIYAFRGAHQESMGLLAQQFNMKRLLLSVTFRCPQSVVREAWWRAPHMKWPDWAKEGNVSTLDGWGLTDLPEDAAIICRNNAPLFGMAIKLLKAGRNCKIVGNDIGKGLLKIMKKFGSFDLPTPQVMNAIDLWQEGQLKKSRSIRAVEDKADCMRLFADQGANLGEAMAYAQKLFEQSGPITLLTGHKAKGLEFDDVFFLDQHLIRHKVEEQEKNLRYVVQTRAKQSLTYVKSEDFEA